MEAVLTLTDQMTGQFRKAAGDTTKISNQVNQQMISMNNGVNRMIKAGAIATVAAVGATSAALVKLTHDTAIMGDELAKTGRQIGWTAEGLQEMQFVAERQGVTSDTLISSFQKLNKNVGDLRANTGALRTILDQTNPSLANQLKNVEGNEEAFNLLVKEIGSLPNQMDKAALAQAAFGRAGQDMLKLIEAGPDGIAALREESRKYGIITNESAAASEAYMDAMANLTAVWGGAKTEIASGLMPSITKLLIVFKEFVVANRGMISQNITAFLSTMKDLFRAMVPYLKAIGQSILFLVDSFDKWAPILKVVLVLFGVYMAAVKIYMAYKFVEGIMSTVKAFGLLSKAQAVLNAVMSANPLALIIIGIAAVIVAVILLVKHWDKVKVALLIVWDAIKKAGIAVWEGIKIAFSAALDFMQGIFFTFADYLITVYATIFKGIVSGAAAIGKLVGLDVSSLEGMISKVEGMQSSVREKSFFGGRGDSQGEQAQNGATAAEKEQAQERSRRDQNSRQRNDVYLHAPQGNGISATPGGTPAMAVNLGDQ